MMLLPGSFYPAVFPMENTVQYNIKYNMHHCNKKVLAFAPVPAVKVVQMYCFL